MSTFLLGSNSTSVFTRSCTESWRGSVALELIIKPTELCNFSCTFCSSTHIADHGKQTLPHQKIYDFLKRFPKTRTIIVNGGDPLMVAPDYYWQIIEH